jgi:broad specificity phosphatase PhoE
MDLGGILLARHGETDDNRPPIRFQGFTDTPLNDIGRGQAGQLAEKVAGDGIASLWASDLSRARETAEIVGERIGLTATLDPRLREAGRGRWEGSRFIDIERTRRARAVRGLAARRRRVPLPGGRVAAGAADPRHRCAGGDPPQRPAAGPRRLSRRQHPGDAVRP